MPGCSYVQATNHNAGRTKHNDSITILHLLDNLLAPPSLSPPPF